MAKYLDDKGLKTFTTKMKDYADGKVGAVNKKVTSHIGDTQNPHKVTKTQVGLDKVDNVKQIPFSEKGTVNGVAELDAKGKVPITQIPETMRINGQSIFGSGDITVSTSLYKIVDTLPTKNIDISKIYLVPATTTADKNTKTEYIYLGDPNKAYDATKWEKLGEEQKNATIETPGGSIVVDTAFNTSSSNPIANKTVAAKFATVDNTLSGKVAKGDYDTAMDTVNSKLKALEDKTIITDSVLSENSEHPIQTQAVYKEVQKLNEAINGKADTTALTSATDRITTLEENGATGVKESGEGNGIASIKKVGKDIIATKGTFVTSLKGYVSNGSLNTTLADYVKSTELVKYYTKTEIDGKGYLTEHQSLANYATQSWVNGQKFAKTSAIPEKTSQLTNDSGFLTEHQSLNGYVNTVDKAASDLPNYSGFAVSYMQKNGNKLEFEMRPFLNTVNVEDTANKDGNGIAEISIDQTKKYILRAKKGKFITEAILGTAIDSYMSGKNYLTEENLNEKLKETVTIKLVSDKSASDTNLNGVAVTVKSGDTTVSTQTWQGTPIKVEVPCDKDVTIEAASVKMYAKPKVLKYIPSPLYNREVTFTYKALETGVFIIDKNDKTYKTANEFLQSPNTEVKDVIGTLLVTNNVALVIANYFQEYVDWGANGLVDGCTVADTPTTAAQDFAGAANTAAIIKAGCPSNTAAAICYNYIFKNGRRGHLMSAGEAVAIQKNISNISSLMNDIGIQSTFIIDSMKYYWTSTQAKNNKVYRLYGSSSTPDATTKGNINYTIPIYSLYD